MPTKSSVLASVAVVIAGVAVYRYPNVFSTGNSGPSVVSSSPIVDVDYAQYQGYFNATSNVTSFLGVRYAAPPIGELRFAAPQKPSHIAGVQLADTEPQTCYQPAHLLGTAPINIFSPNATKDTSHPFQSTSHPFQSTSHPFQSLPHWLPLSGSEDCLFLNVFSPGTDLNTSLPTVVWIHGGGYATGGIDSYYGPDLITNAHGGVVVVTIQYRLGLFGFLAGQAVKDHGALNAGLLDQELALQWVRDHIHKFGGDPSKVTIWGESAGGGSVLQHVVAHGGKTTPPLFRAAIASSPYLPPQYNYNDAIPEIVYRDALTRANCDSATNTLACLRSTDTRLLLSIFSDIHSSALFGKTTFNPVVDGEFDIERPLATLAKGNHNGDILLVTANTNEGDMFIDPSNPGIADVAWIIRQYLPTLTPEEVSRAAEIYAPTPELDAIQQSRRIIGETMFVCPAYSLLKAFGENGYKGEFAVSRAGHGEDMPYYFFTRMAFPMFRPPQDSPRFVANFAQSFASMIMSLDPNRKFDESNTLPHWEPWASGHEEMWFGTSPEGESVIKTVTADHELLKRCEFWEAVAPSNGQ